MHAEGYQHRHMFQDFGWTPWLEADAKQIPESIGRVLEIWPDVTVQLQDPSGPASEYRRVHCCGG
jgi:hypothetical protein